MATTQQGRRRAYMRTETSPTMRIQNGASRCSILLLACAYGRNNLTYWDSIKSRNIFWTSLFDSKFLTKTSTVIGSTKADVASQVKYWGDINTQSYNEHNGMGYNEFGEFPEDGYSDEVGSVSGNRRYSCAASASWHDERTLFIKVQIIDTYFGNI